MLDTAHPRDRTVAAVLGPTNTGKTHYAIERMLGHRTGVIGLPLRLLAREVYDRVVALRGPSVVALVTGEERIVPPRTQYWVCTVEAMPLEIGADFVAVDEIQLCGDSDRGHVFTDRLLFARGLHETLFLGAETMRSRIAALIPQARFVKRERFSQLSYSGSKKLSRLPARSAVVGFSVEAVYAMAELLRRQRGGAAVVMGALSPRTRNAQVDLYQNGDVDYMVATDAIGMGLNLDIRHVAFSGLAKFDGRRHRRLHANELAQIAGRAGRHENDGTFGVTGEAGPIDDELIEAIEAHRFAPLARLQWRNSRLEFGSLEALVAALEIPPGREDLTRAREADDLAALRALGADPEIAGRARRPAEIRRLWDVCQVPDFRKVGPAEHQALLSRIFHFLGSGRGCIPSDWLAGQLRRIDRVEGDIDALSKRLAYVRTWTYVAQRAGWVEEEDHWREETRAVEDRLSDALHARLTQRFVDRRTSVLVRRLKQRERLVAEVSTGGEVTVEGQFMGRLEGFLFRPDPDASPEEARTLRAAGREALQVEFNKRADRFYNAPDPEIGLTEQGGLMWGEHAVGKLVAGADPYSPEVRAFVDEHAGPSVAEKVARRLTHWINRRIATQFEPLMKLRDDEAISGLARGVAFRLVESLGVIPREEIADDIKALDQGARSGLRKHGVRFGQYTIFQTAVLKPAPTQLRLVLWGLFSGLDEFPSAPPPGLVTISAIEGASAAYYPKAGYRLSGERAIRIDMLERLADMIRGRDSRAGFEASPDMLSITGLSLEQFAKLMEGLGYRAEKGERPRQRAEPASREPAAETAADVTEADVTEADVTEADVTEADVTEADVTATGVPDTGVPDTGVPDTGVPVTGDRDVPAPEIAEPHAAAADMAAAEGAPEQSAEPEAAAPGGEAALDPALSASEDGALAAPPVAPEILSGAAEGEAPSAEGGEDEQAGPAKPVETESFYTFRWAPPRRGGGRGRPQERDGNRQAGTDPDPASPATAADAPGRRRRDRGRRGKGDENAQPGAAAAAGPQPGAAGDAPRGKPKGGKPDHRPDGKHGPRRDGRKPGADKRGPEKSGPRVFSAAPPDASDKAREAGVDPDNPFAALLALKQSKD